MSQRQLKLKLRAATFTLIENKFNMRKRKRSFDWIKLIAEKIRLTHRRKSKEIEHRLHYGSEGRGKY